MHYVILFDWAVDNGEVANGIEIVAVVHTLEEAKEIFAEKVVDEKEYAEENGYKIFTDTDTEFDAGEEGYYAAEHAHFWIQEVN